MRAAAAQIVIERTSNLVARRCRIAVEQRLGRDQDAAETIAALARLLLKKGLLQRMRLVRRAKAFDGRDAAAGDACDRAPAGFHRRAINQNKAAAALLKATAETRADQPELIAQDIEQRHVVVRHDNIDGPAVDGEGDGLRHRPKALPIRKT